MTRKLVLGRSGLPLQQPRQGRRVHVVLPRVLFRIVRFHTVVFPVPCEGTLGVLLETPVPRPETVTTLPSGRLVRDDMGIVV